MKNSKSYQRSSKNHFDDSFSRGLYNDQWPELFKLEKEQLKRVFNKQSIEIEHIGSTSVPSLSSKPIIEIMIGIESYPLSDELIHHTCSLGYFFHGEAESSWKTSFHSA